MTTKTHHDTRREHDADWSLQRDAGTACARATIGGRQLVRRLADSRFGARYLARDPRRDTDCILWLFDHVPGDRGPSVWAYLKRTAGIRRPHVLAIEAAGRDTTGTWAATPYVGNHDGIVSLESLRAARGGAMSPFEVRRVIDQLLDASAAAHKAGEHHGELDPECILVNPRGTLEIGMYGLVSSIEGDRAGEDLIADEVRSIGLIAQRLLLGDAGDAARATTDRARTNTPLRAWIRRACDPIDGFDTASDAIAALPERHDDTSERRLESARALLGKLSAVVTSGRSRSATSETGKTSRP